MCYYGAKEMSKQKKPIKLKQFKRSEVESFAGVDRKETENVFRTVMPYDVALFKIHEELKEIRQLLEKGIGVFEIER